MKLLFVFFFALLGFLAVNFFYPKPSVVKHLTDSNMIFVDINKFRKLNNLNPLTLTQDLCTFAKVRIIQIHTDWSHNGFLNSKELKYHYYCPLCTSMGENLARHIPIEQGVVDAWIASPVHKEILLGNWTQGCVAVDPDGNYAVLEVAR